jgi:hypothetical protein
MKSILLASALALSAMTTSALAGTATLTDTQLDGITAGAHVETTTIYRGNSSNIACSGTCDTTTAPEGWTSTTTEGPKGQVVNKDTTTCNNCSTTPRTKPGK